MALTFPLSLEVETVTGRPATCSSVGLPDSGALLEGDGDSCSALAGIPCKPAGIGRCPHPDTMSPMSILRPRGVVGRRGATCSVQRSRQQARPRKRLYHPGSWPAYVGPEHGLHHGSVVGHANSGAVADSKVCGIELDWSSFFELIVMDHRRDLSLDPPCRCLYVQITVYFGRVCVNPGLACGQLGS